MLPDRSLCRFCGKEGGARLGFLQGGQLYDLTALGESAYADLGAWLVAAAGRAAEVMVALEAAAAGAAPFTSAEALLAGDEWRLLPPIDRQEVWACGVTYEMSREARMRESEEPTIYDRVYHAERPEIFFKATPHRVVGPGEAVGIRADSHWDVPEAELTLVWIPLRVGTARAEYRDIGWGRQTG